MSDITINCDAEVDKTINVTTGDIITVIGEYTKLPDWFAENKGTVPYPGKWSIEVTEEDSIITIQSPKFRLSLQYLQGYSRYIEVYQENAPQKINLPIGKWKIDNTVYSDVYTISSDCVALEVVE